MTSKLTSRLTHLEMWSLYRPMLPLQWRWDNISSVRPLISHEGGWNPGMSVCAGVQGWCWWGIPLVFSFWHGILFSYPGQGPAHEAGEATISLGELSYQSACKGSKKARADQVGEEVERKKEEIGHVRRHKRTVAKMSWWQFRSQTSHQHQFALFRETAKWTGLR